MASTRLSFAPSYGWISRWWTRKGIKPFNLSVKNWLAHGTSAFIPLLPITHFYAITMRVSHLPSEFHPVPHPIPPLPSGFPTIFSTFILRFRCGKFCRLLTQLGAAQACFFSRILPASCRLRVAAVRAEGNPLTHHDEDLLRTINSYQQDVCQLNFLYGSQVLTRQWTVPYPKGAGEACAECRKTHR